MRSLLVVLIPVLASVAISACGGSHVGGRSGPATSSTGHLAAVAHTGSGHFRGDEDDDDPSRSWNSNNPNDKDVDVDNDPADNIGKGFHDGDDNSVLRYGHRARGAERKEIVSVIDRYFAAAAAEDGATGCSLTFSLLADALPEDYGHAPGPLYLRGDKNCGVILTAIFKHQHSELVQPVKVTEVRISEHRGLAVLGSPTLPASETELRSELGSWKIDRVLTQRVP
jgi:hypothetical protein